MKYAVLRPGPGRAGGGEGVACPEVLKPEQCVVLGEIQRYISDTGDLLARCKEAGLDVETFEARQQEQARLAAALKRAFFPQEP